MNKPCIILGTMLVCFSCVSAWAASEVAPSVPNLSLPVEEEAPAKPAAEQISGEGGDLDSNVTIEKAAPKGSPTAKKTGNSISMNNAKVSSNGEMVEQIRPNKNLLPKE